MEQTPGATAAVTPAAERSSITLGELMAMTPEELDEVVIVEKEPIPGRPVPPRGIGPV